MATSCNKLKLGAVPYLNAKPLIYAWEREPQEEVELIYDVPSQLAKRLKKGELDAALLSSLVGLAETGFEPVPGLGIASWGAVQSVKLFCRVDLRQVRRVALDTSSLTSAALTKILLQERFGLTPTYLDHPPDLAAMLQQADAALLIGDPGLAQHLQGAAGLTSGIREVLDLGQAWTEWTGLPFVFALWTARTESLSASLAQALQAAARAGQAAIPEIAQAESARLGLSVEVCEHYLRHVIVYELGETEQAGLRRFAELAKKLKLIG